MDLCHSSFIFLTVGYGNLAPVTAVGQTLFCFYALFGIPLFIFYMAILGRALSDVWDRTVQRWIIRNNKGLKYMSFLLLLAMGFVLFLAIPAIIFATIDEWPYTTSLYFVAVTLTTVGFGDVLPEGPRDTFRRGIYVTAIVGWLFVALAFTSVVFTKVSKFYEKADTVIATKMVTRLKKRSFIHACGCLRGQDCTAKVEAEQQPENTEDNRNVEVHELEGDKIEIDDVEDGFADVENPNADTSL